VGRAGPRGGSGRPGSRCPRRAAGDRRLLPASQLDRVRPCIPGRRASGGRDQPHSPYLSGQRAALHARPAGGERARHSRRVQGVRLHADGAHAAGRPSASRACVRGAWACTVGHEAVCPLDDGGVGRPPWTTTADRYRSQPRTRGRLHVRDHRRAQGRHARLQHRTVDHPSRHRSLGLLRARRDPHGLDPGPPDGLSLWLLPQPAPGGAGGSSRPSV
jgi:hypothetical protein